MKDKSFPSTSDPPDPWSFSTESGLERILGATGFPLSFEPSESDLLRAALQLRDRRRSELMLFLGRLIARSIQAGSESKVREPTYAEDHL